MPDTASPDTVPAPLWVFGYGSLIWNPEFPVAERRIAHAPGWRRSFCMWSIHYRGTPEAPGLVLALDAAEDPGVRCTGVALRVASGAEAETLAQLRERELISRAYLETWIDLDLEGGGHQRALAFVIDRTHAQYCGALTLAEQAAIIAQARGGRGWNRDYLWSTVEHLRDLGIPDDDLQGLAALVRGHSAG